MNSSEVLDAGYTSFGSRIWRPRYIPVFRSIWCGRRNSPLSLSSTYVGRTSASADRRMPRLEGVVFRFGTAISILFHSVRCRQSGWLPVGSRNENKLDFLSERRGLYPQNHHLARPDFRIDIRFAPSRFLFAAALFRQKRAIPNRNQRVYKRPPMWLVV